MRKQMEIDFKDYPEFRFHHMTDVEFMETHPKSGPFDLVFFDGPHMSKDVMTEAVWFANRSRRGTRFVFDDHTHYDMSIIAYALTIYGFKTIESGMNKICLEKK
jgi:16S rRNA G966 N2-methylase RsmD